MDEMKKYIIEFSEDPHTIRLMKIKNGDKFPITEFKTVEPYTEPDLEQVREDAFKNGYDAACKDIDIKSKTNAAYRKGLEDAWEAARKIDHMSDEDIKNVFGCGFSAVFETIGASEAIEKIRQYEQEKEEQIQVGDEVINQNKTAVVTEITDRYTRIMYSDGSGYALFAKGLTKTGRHFPEIAEVLQKMKEA